MTPVKIKEILADHELWLRKEGGKKADLSRADLSRADFRGANLSGASLYRADLSRADLSRADLSGANLRGASLYRADLSGANLCGANLRGSNLTWADLRLAIGIIRVGPASDGYEFFGVKHSDVVYIKAGCRWFTADQAREHWFQTRGDTDLGAQRLRLVDFIERELS